MFFGSQRSQKKSRRRRNHAALPLGELVATCKQHTDEERSSRGTDGESILEQTPPGRAGAALGSEACEGETGEKPFLLSLQDL